MEFCWRDVPGDDILNCFRYTGLVLGRTTARRSRNDDDDQLTTSLLSQMCQLRTRNPMALNDFICCTAEADTDMEALTTTALLCEEGDAGFLLTAKKEQRLKRVGADKRRCHKHSDRDQRPGKG